MGWEYKIYRTVGEIAKFLGLSQKKVIEMIHNKQLPVVKEGNLWTMSNKDYDEFRRGILK